MRQLQQSGYKVSGTQNQVGQPFTSGVEIRGPNANEQSEKAHWLKILEGDRARMLFKQPFTANLSFQLILKPVIDSRLPTAATDGRTVFFNINFLSCLSESDRLFVFAHEIWHAVAGHFVRRYEREPELWNLATDHEVNSILAKDGFEMPTDAVYFIEYEGHSAEQVYNALINSSIYGSSHLFQFDEHNPDSLLFTNAGSDSTVVVDSDFSPEAGDANLAREWTERMVQAHQQMKTQGTLPKGLTNLINQFVTATVPWNQVLRNFVRKSYGGGQRHWRKCSRRHLHRGLWFPGLRAEVLKILVAVDTSGSTQAAWGKFMGEVISLLGEFDKCEITLVECDEKISRIRHLTNWDDLSGLQKLGIQGGGGTDLRPPFAVANQDRPDCLIYLTDGYGSAPVDSPEYPVLWVLTADGTTPASWGHVVTFET